ncbi:hypothetical protein [Brevundimonas sp. C43]|nr:hypothetical protein [Brevundimonas sp. C43]
MMPATLTSRVFNITSSNLDGQSDWAFASSAGGGVSAFAVCDVMVWTTSA